MQRVCGDVEASTARASRTVRQWLGQDPGVMRLRVSIRFGAHATIAACIAFAEFGAPQGEQLDVGTAAHIETVWTSEPQMAEQQAMAEHEADERAHEAYHAGLSDDERARAAMPSVKDGLMKAAYEAERRAVLALNPSEQPTPITIVVPCRHREKDVLQLIEKLLNESMPEVRAGGHWFLMCVRKSQFPQTVCVLAIRF